MKILKEIGLSFWPLIAIQILIWIGNYVSFSFMKMGMGMGVFISLVIIFMGRVVKMSSLFSKKEEFSLSSKIIFLLSFAGLMISWSCLNFSFMGFDTFRDVITLSRELLSIDIKFSSIFIFWMYFSIGSILVLFQLFIPFFIRDIKKSRQ